MRGCLGFSPERQCPTSLRSYLLRRIGNSIEMSDECAKHHKGDNNTRVYLRIHMPRTARRSFELLCSFGARVWSSKGLSRPPWGNSRPDFHIKRVMRYGWMHFTPYMPPGRGEMWCVCVYGWLSVKNDPSVATPHQTTLLYSTPHHMLHMPYTCVMCGFVRARVYRCVRPCAAIRCVW